MSRRHRAERRELLPDPKFGSLTVSRFMNSVMKQGKKSVAEKIVYGAMDAIGEKNPNALELVEKALGNVEKLGKRTKFIDALQPAEEPRKGPGADFRRWLPRRRPVGATVLWSYAVLTREQALVTVVAYALWRVAPPLRRFVTGDADDGADGDPAGNPESRAGGSTNSLAGGRPPGLADLAWVVPGLTFVVWQLVLWRSTGDLPAASAGGSNLVPPFSALAPGLVDWASGGLPRLHVAAPLQLAAVGAAVLAAARSTRTIPGGLGYAAVAAALAAVAATCLAASIWRDPSDMRHLVDVSVWSTVVVVVARRPPPRWFVVLVPLTWAATAAVRVLAP